MGLAEYGRKRHFDKTSEPAPKTPAKGGWSYVIQKHDATRLHYDFRLELDGVLKSWAVPKGPSLDPSVKRLAVEVEDHPVAYGSFEGIIPEGEYGGGTVLLWDTGYWEPIGDPHEGFLQGKLKFQLHGQKLRGGWAMIRTHRPGSSDVKPQWLLFKEKDEEAMASDRGDVLENLPLSVATERDLSEIARAGDHVWSSKKSASKRSSTVKKSATTKFAKAKTVQPKTHVVKAKHRGTSHDALPTKIDVQLATLTDKAPEGDDWCHEIKFDGYRMVCRIDHKKATLITRNHNDWTDRLPELAAAASKLPCKQAVLDGEIVMLQSDGTTDFQALQNAFRDGRTHELIYYVFDLLYCDGQSYTERPLEERKSALSDLISKAKHSDRIRYSDHVVGHGGDFNQQACRLHLEGTISKRRNQPYRPGRGDDWLKVKCIHDEEFVIGGFTEPGGARVGFGALLVGFFDDEKQLHFAGKVGTGFDARQLQEMYARFKALEQPQSPFVDLERKVGAARTAHWIKPVLIGQFKFASRTRDNKLRHASFQGFREDKPATEVTLESPIPVKKVQSKAASSNGKGSHSMKKPVKRTKGTSAHEITANRSNDRVAMPDGLYDADSETFAGARLTHAQKVLYPETGITKLELAEYYYAVSDWILPQLAHRPIVLLRCPEGSAKECFYQKHPGLGTPATLRQIPIVESKKTANYLVVDDLPGLLALTQIGALEIHVWGSREDNLEKPDRLVFDLDPDPSVEWHQVVDSANQIRQFLEQLGLESFVKTTGGKGLHLVVPLDRKHDWDEAKAFCSQVANLIVTADPSKFTANMSKAARTNKIFIDYLRNGRGATSVVAYSTRARPNATVSMPVAWSELTAKLTSDHFTIRNAMSRLTSQKQDPWEKLSSTRQSLSAPIKQIKSLVADR